MSEKQETFEELFDGIRKWGKEFNKPIEETEAYIQRLKEMLEKQTGEK